MPAWLPIAPGAEAGLESGAEAGPEPQHGGAAGRQRVARRAAAAAAAALLAAAAVCRWAAAPAASGLSGMLPGAEVAQAQALFEEGGRFATVRFSHGGQEHEYRLEAASVYAKGAGVLVHGEDGVERLDPGPVRTFELRESGRWANARLGEDGAIAGLFQHRGRVLRVRPLDGEASLFAQAAARLPSAGRGRRHIVHHLQPVDLERGHVEGDLGWVFAHSENVAAGRRLGGAMEAALRAVGEHQSQMASATDNATEFKLVRDPVKAGQWHMPSGHNWPDDESPKIGTSNVWEGDRWYPGCYQGDDNAHALELGIISDVRAYETSGKDKKKLKADLEQYVSHASFVYQMQMNIRLVIGNLTMYTSAQTAPEYAKDCTGISSRDPDDDDGYKVLAKKLRAMPGKVPFAGATHIFTSCVIYEAMQKGGWSLTVGLAKMSQACTHAGVGANLLQGDDTFLTFAHELGHNLAGDHSFEEGMGKTGGIMDYGDGKHEGVYQFNSKHRKTEMCRKLNSMVGKCQGKFVITDSAGETPAPPDVGHKCKTVPDGKTRPEDYQSKPCKFPFKYNGRTYETCTSDGEMRLWCATSTKSDGYVDKWDYCRCCDYTTSQGKCIFPFKYWYNTFYTCINANHDHVWCAVKPGNNLNYGRGQYGNCDLSC